MRVAALLLLWMAAACEPALKLPDRPSESYVASGATWQPHHRAAGDRVGPRVLAENGQRATGDRHPATAHSLRYLILNRRQAADNGQPL